MNEIIYWYPLRITYSREIKVKGHLDEIGVESYIPMHHVEKNVKGELKRLLVPVVHNLIFVRSCRMVIDDIKTNSQYANCIRYMINPENKKPITIPEKQMRDFISVSSQYNESIMYLSAKDVLMKKGERVRIKSGIWKGVEGKFVRIKRGLRVVVEIEGLMVVATTSLHPSMVEKIE